MFDKRSKGLIRGLIYPIQFEKNPDQAVDRILDHVVKPTAMGASAIEYLEAIRIALAGAEQLSSMIPQEHSEIIIRAYLAELQKRLEERLVSVPASANSNAVSRLEPASKLRR